VELRVAREVHGRVGEAVVRAEDPPAAVDERVDLERRTHADRGHADDHRRPADRHRGDGQVDRFGAADRLEHEVGSAVGEVAQSLERIGWIAGEDRGGGPDRSGRLELGGDAVDGDDRSGLGQRRAHHAGQPDTAQPDHRDGAARRHLRGLGDRPHARRDAAADERGRRGIDPVGNPDGRRRRHDLGVGQRADRAVGQDILAVGASPTCTAIGHAVAE
jgi:hypothetical protein